MEEQQSREFASADAAAGAQDAAVQESGVSPEISFHTRRRLQYLQRPTPSHLRPNAPRASRCRDDHVADRRRSGLTIPEAPDTSRSSSGNVTISRPVLRQVDITIRAAHCDKSKSRNRNPPPPTGRVGHKELHIREPAFERTLVARPIGSQVPREAPGGRSFARAR